MPNNQDEIEIIIFSKFSKTCGISIIPESIVKMQPPHPDIKCQTSSYDFLSFELIQIIDNNFSKLHETQIKTKNRLIKYISNLNIKAEFRINNILSNALIYINFKSTCPLRDRIKMFPYIIEEICKVDINFEGDISIINSKYRNIIQSINLNP